MTAGVTWFLDVESKRLALTFLTSRESFPLIGNFLQLRLIKNSGAAFSFASSGTIFLSGFSLIVIFLIAFWARRITSRAWALTLGLVLGGTLGNLSDRTFRGGSGRGVFRGEVIDWIQLPHWPIFNFADSAIVIAASFAVVLSLRNIAPISREI